MGKLQNLLPNPALRSIYEGFDKPILITVILSLIMYLTLQPKKNVDPFDAMVALL